MPKVINRTKPQRLITTRALIRDKSLKATPKLLYMVLYSLSQSYENTFPSYKFLAEEIGYEINHTDKNGEVEDRTKTERALYKFINANLDPLIENGLVKKVKSEDGQGYDYEVYEHEEQPCGQTVDNSNTTEPKGSVPLNQKVQSVYTISNYKLVARDFINNKTPGEYKKWGTRIMRINKSELPDEESFKFYMRELIALRDEWREEGYRSEIHPIDFEESIIQELEEEIDSPKK